MELSRTRTVSTVRPEDIDLQLASTSGIRVNPAIWVVCAAFAALLGKLVIAYNTFGTNDVVTFYSFARSLTENGLESTYRHSISFNHPPLTAYYLELIYGLDHQSFFRDTGLSFPFLLRFPGIIADFVVVLVVLQMRELRLPIWALVLFALSPASLMVSGFHGNTDPIMVMFLVLAAFMCLRQRAVLCGIFFALSCQVKVVPLLFAPILFFFWLSRRNALRFVVTFALVMLVLWIEPISRFPALFFKNVLSYGSFWGLWGITYWLRLTGLHDFSFVTFFNFPPAENVVVTALKFIIIAAVLLIAWRRRQLGSVGLLHSMAYAWIVFFALSPGVCAQYVIWLAPFVLLLSPGFYAVFTGTSALFLFFFYNVIAGGMPWYLGISTEELNTVWTPWSVWPWAALLLALVLFWKKARETDPSLRMFSLRTLPAQANG